MLLHMIVSAVLFFVILFFVFHTTVVQSNEKELNEAQASLTQAQMLNDTYLRSISDYMIQAMDAYELQGTLYGTTFTEYLSIRSRSTYENLTDVSNLISSVELVNYNTQTVLDGNGRYSFDKFGDSELLELSTPFDYADIRFETETYRSGKHHVKKTRDKENPWAKRIGRHEGAQFYTIGQRKGLGIGGHANPVFVLATDIDRNIIYVGEGENHPGLLRKCLHIAPDEIHWIRPDQAMQVGEQRRYRVRIRYRQPLQDATLLMRENGLFILFDQPQRSITPGQFAVWYAADGEMLGSGVI